MLTLLLVFVITTAWAQGSVSYRAYNASTNQFEDGVAASTTAVTEETTAMSEGWYVVSGNVNVSGRIEVTGIVNLILCDGVTLTATQGLHVPTGVTLNIYGQSGGTGGLTATQGGSDQAGIGGNSGEVSGTITIHGGNVTSTGGWSGAGIGGGHDRPCGSITIYGGTVNAHGGDRAAGIGGGTGEYSGGSITIMGGTVTAWANNINNDYDNSQAIGIGMVNANNAGICNLFLGDVKVYNSSSATTPVAFTDRESTCRSKYVRLAICDHHYVNNECTYCGAEQNFIPIPYLVYDTESECFVQHTANVATYVKATSTTMGVAGSETYYAVKNDVTVSSRLEVLGTVHLILCDGKTLTATGGITVHAGNTLNIHGQECGTGAIVATSSGGNNAAIGTLAAHYNPGTINSNCGTINFHGGTITATGGAWSAAIGGGVNDGGGAINIYGGHISASATNPSQGNQQAFGQGSSGSNVTRHILDGLRVYANNNSTPTSYNNRISGLGNKKAVVEPCHDHHHSDDHCSYCGITCYGVTYNSNGATSGTVPTDVIAYVSGQTVTVHGNTGNLERTGYLFAGWNTKADGSGITCSAGDTFTISDNITLYAKWTPILVLANNLDNSSAISAAAASGKYHNVTLADRTLYLDGTWNTLVLPFNLASLDGTPLEGFTVKTLQSSTLVNGELTLNFANANSIEAGKPYIVKWDQAPISNLVNPVFEGVLISDATANVSTTYADFIGSYVPITGDGLLVDAHNPNGDAMHAAIRAKLNGYSVSCYTQPDINFPATTIPFSADGNVTLWTICIPIDYSITYNLNGGTNHPGNPATYNIESATITLQEPSKTNYIFGGWFDNEDCTGDAVTTIAHGSHGNVTLYAKWLVENLELVANGDNSSAISEAAASGRYCNVTLADCTIYTEGSWNTLCLPFSLASLTGTPLEGLTVKTLESSTFSDGTLTMNFSDATSIEAGKPYIVKREADLVINSTTDWNTFAYNVLHEESYEGKLVRLGADITVDSTVGFDFDGGDSYAFKGTFDGCGHTLTVNYAGKAVGPAPFMCAAGSYVIKNLIVAGTINTTENQAAGFVGNSYGNGTIRNCRSSVVIKSDYKGDAGEGGFVAMLNNSASLTMEDCVFDGKILTVGTNATTNCAGLVGYKHNGATLTMNNCLYAPAALTGSETAVSSGCATFARNASSFTNCYYTQTFGTAQGTNASGMSTAELLAALGSGWEIRDGQVFPKMADNIVNPVFSNVLINTATANVETTYADFIGTYAPITDDGLLLDSHNPNGDAMHAAIKAKREGYTFEGWYSDAALTTPATAIPFATNGTVTIYTKWTPIEYSITYNLNGGTNHPGNPATYNIESANITLQAPEKSGYNFGGWFENEDCTGDAVTTIALGSHGNVTLYAKWTPILVLANNIDNSSAISSAAASGKYHSVILTDRTIYRDGDWNTLVLPFNLATLTGTPLEGLTVKTLESSTFSDGTLTLNCSDATSIEAGKPYIVKDNADFVIRTAADWNTIANNVNNGTNNYQGKVVKLAADISVTTMVGNSSNPFKGTFDGCGHTLNVSISGGNYTAPFSCVGAASIRNLKVDGSVTTTNGHPCGGLVGFINGALTITNCVSSVTFTSGYKGNAADGGILGLIDNNSGNVTIEDCAFMGKILTTNGTTDCGGIVGWRRPNGVTLTIKNCLYAPTTLAVGETEPTSSCKTICRYSDPAPTITNCYYTRTLGDAQGTDASGMSNETLVGNLGSGWEIRDGQVVPKMADNIVNPVFSNVLISDATANVSTDHADFIGSYAPINDAGLLLDAHNPDGDAMHAAISITLSEPTRDGYTFGGWYTDAGLTTPLSTIISFATNGNVTFYGKWTPHTYIVRFNKNHEDASGTMDDQPFTYGTEQALTANVFTAPTGYMFAGWSTTTNGEVEYIDGQSVSNLATEQDAVVNLYAQWSEYCTLFAEGSTNQWMTWCDDDEWSVAAAPVKVYTVSGISGSTVTLTEENSGRIPANTPLLIQRTDNGTSAITVPLRTKGTTASTLFAAASTDCTFYGNPTDLAITTGDYFTADQSYVLYGDKFLMVDTDEGIAPHRCLLTLTSLAGVRRLDIIFDDGSEQTGIRSIDHSPLTIDHSAGAWYDMQGRKVANGQRSMVNGQSLKKGLYIYNGKKTVIK